MPLLNVEAIFFGTFFVISLVIADKISNFAAKYVLQHNFKALNKVVK